MKRLAFVLLCLFLGVTMVVAQTTKVTGVVLSVDDNEPIIGVSVVVEGTTLGTVTNLDGMFSLEVPQNSRMLLFSYIGMNTQELEVKPVMRVILESSSQVLDEVMVVAYGTTKKSSFTGAASTLNTEKTLKDIPVTSFEQALQGAAAGLTVSSNSGQPGAKQNIRIRGIGSMNASNEPLFVIDGIPVVSGEIAVSYVANDTKSFNPMSSVNPSDIESITVLKDAAAASLYGSRAANGVILITTKKGKEGKTLLNFKANWGFSDWAVRNRKSVSGEQRHELTYEAYYNEGILYKDMSDEDAKAYAQQGADLFAPLQDQYTDWEDLLFRKKAFNQNYEFSAQGGNEQTHFFASLGYRTEEGKVIHTGIDGFTGRANMQHKSKDGKIQIGASIAFSKQKSDVSVEGTADENPYWVKNLYATSNLPAYNEDGSFYTGFPLDALGVSNPLKDLGLNKNTSDVLRSSNSLWVSYEFMKGLTLKETISYDYVDNQSTTYWPIASNNGKLNNGLMIKYPYQHHNVYSSTILNYTKTFDKRHNLDVLLGWDVDDRREQYVLAMGSNYPHDKLPELENSAVALAASSGYKEDHLLSLLSRVNYDYEGKYYLSGNYRRDGSSRLGANSRWGNFWSASAAWRLSKEDFMQNLTFVDDLKVRASYGVNGTLPTDLYSHLSLFGYGFTYQDKPGSAPTSIANPDLGWEKNLNFNIGFDARLFNRLSILFDFYNRKTKDLLQDVPVSPTTGFTKTLKNVGAMNNRGVELDVNYEVFNQAPVRWSTGLILSHNRNKISKLYDGKDIINGTMILREGEAYYSWWSREWAGVDPQTGEEQWVLNTLNDDGSVNRELTKDPAEAQRVIVGNPDPKLTGGWRNSLSWMGIELEALFSFSLGGHIMDDQALSYTDTDGYAAYLNIGVQQLDRWQKPGDVTKVPRRVNNYLYALYGSSRHMYSSNHLRLKTLTISYNLPARWMQTAGMRNVRIFASGTNLLTWAAYKNVDPEQPVNGTTNWALPNLKTVTFGIEIGL